MGRRAQGRGRLKQPVGKRPRVALVAHDVHDTGGMERSCSDLIRGLEQVDWTVVSATLQSDLRRLVKWIPVPVPRRPFPAKFSAFWVVAGARVPRVDVDIVHTVGAIIPGRIDVASVHFCHAAFNRLSDRAGIRPSGGLRRVNHAVHRRLALAAERQVYRPEVTRLLCPVSAGTAREIAEHYPGMPVHVTPNGVDVQRFRPDPGDRRALRAEAGIGDDDVVALFVGGDWYRKGLDLALAGLADAHARGATRLKLWVVGRGDAQRYRKMGDELGVSASVRYWGSRHDIERWFRAADVFVLPTLYETFGLAAFEAAASGVPVVASAVNGIDELIGEDEAGIRVARTPGGVGDALFRLAVDSELRARLGRAARARAGNYSWEASRRSVMAAYTELLSPRTTRIS